MHIVHWSMTLLLKPVLRCNWSGIIIFIVRWIYLSRTIASQYAQIADRNQNDFHVVVNENNVCVLMSHSMKSLYHSTFRKKKTILPFKLSNGVNTCMIFKIDSEQGFHLCIFFLWFCHPNLLCHAIVCLFYCYSVCVFSFSFGCKSSLRHCQLFCEEAKQKDL